MENIPIVQVGNMDKKKLEKRLENTESALTSALLTYLVSNKKIDRDRALLLKGKKELLIDIIKEFK